MNEWISVEDHIPEIIEASYVSREVLVCVEAEKGTTYDEGERYMAIDRRVKMKGFPNIEWRSEAFKYGKVTHWREMPELPSIKES